MLYAGCQGAHTPNAAFLGSEATVDVLNCFETTSVCTVLFGATYYVCGYLHAEGETVIGSHVVHMLIPALKATQ